eukprot:2596451-Pyramimonas_sp.AAC.1
MMGRVLSSPSGFSINQKVDFKYTRQASVDATKRSAAAKSLGRVVIAREYSVHGGEAQIRSKSPGE